MLRLTEQLFLSKPKAAYADCYERALYNHILASINPTTPGYVYFTPIRPGHYRVYSQPEQCSRTPAGPILSAARQRYQMYWELSTKSR